MKKLLYATNNPGKFFEVSKLLKTQGIDVVAPKDLKIDLDVEESGISLKQNAILKAKAFLSTISSIKINPGVNNPGVDEYIVIADDTGVEIDALSGEPGIHVRRWKDGKTRMSDKEVINYCLMRLKGIPKNQRTVRFHTVFALAHNGQIETFDGFLKGIILEKADKLRFEGFPFETIFFIPEWNKLLGQIHTLSIDEKIKKNYLTHRERSLLKAIPKIKTLLGL